MMQTLYGIQIQYRFYGAFERQTTILRSLYKEKLSELVIQEIVNDWLKRYQEAFENNLTLFPIDEKSVIVALIDFELQ